MRVLLLDNYDSFTYNLAHMLREISDVRLLIAKHDQITLDAIGEFDKIILSPGPGVPEEYPLVINAIQHYFTYKPILGVCLGMQAMYEAFGGSLLNLQTVHHGVSSSVTIVDPHDNVFHDIAPNFLAGRYHSWVCDPVTLPPALFITAKDAHGNMMACRHGSFPLHGIQFHPESILTPHGKQMIENFIYRCNM
jgi:anthranilate synthase component 2